MKIRASARSSTVLAVLTLSACGYDAEIAHDPASCERDAEGQALCLSDHFQVAACSDARVLGSAFRNEPIAYNHWTAFAVSADCLAGLREKAQAKGFATNPEGELVAEGEAGYRQKLQMTETGENTEGSVIWERIQE
ncbi:hypothetical protein [Erythrobacter sp. MTPC3]|uniref:hypothetical protein n=1 Tax=Erythrobacter sp. MTPC3 TaxID=3056564 RepID=UPI0036F326F8